MYLRGGVSEIARRAASIGKMSSHIDNHRAIGQPADGGTANEDPLNGEWDLKSADGTEGLKTLVFSHDIEEYAELIEKVGQELQVACLYEPLPLTRAGAEDPGRQERRVGHYGH